MQVAQGDVPGEITEMVRFRSLGWWVNSSRLRGANHGKPTHSRSGPRRRWETMVHNYVVGFLGEAWIDALASEEAQKHKRSFASQVRGL